MFWTFIVVCASLPFVCYALQALLQTKEYVEMKHLNQNLAALNAMNMQNNLVESYKRDRFKDVQAYLNSNSVPVVRLDTHAFQVEDMDGSVISTRNLPRDYEANLHPIFGSLYRYDDVYHVTMWYYLTLFKTLREGYFGDAVMQKIDWKFTPGSILSIYRYVFSLAVEQIGIHAYGRRFRKEPDTKLSSHLAEIGFTHQHLVALRDSLIGFGTSIALRGERGSTYGWLYPGQLDFEALYYWSLFGTPWEDEASNHSIANPLFMCALIHEVSLRTNVTYEDAKRKLFELGLQNSSI